MFRVMLPVLVVGFTTLAIGLPELKSAPQDNGQAELKALAPGELPPGWLPLDRLDDKAEWKTFRTCPGHNMVA